MRFAVALVFLAVLAGCAQYDETRRANLEMAAQEQVAAHDATCQASGFKPGSAEYDDCRKRLANEQANKGTRGYQRMLNVMENDRGGRPFGQ
jgi:hypothetical protein